MSIENVIQNSVQITGLNAGASISERFPAEWGVTNFLANGDVDSHLAISSQQTEMLKNVLLFEYEGDVYAYSPTIQAMSNGRDVNVDAILADKRLLESASWIPQAELTKALRANKTISDDADADVDEDGDATDKVNSDVNFGWYRTSMSIAAGSGALTLFNSFVPLAGRAANLSVAGAMVVPIAIITGMLNYYLQIQKYKQDNNGVAPTGEALEKIKHDSKLLTYQMGAAVLGATAATIAFEQTGLGSAFESWLGGAGSSIGGASMEFQIGMMLASGLGLAIGLTAMCAYQVWSGKDTNAKHKKVSHFAAVFAIGLAVGMGAVLASTFLPHGLRQAGSPGVVAKLAGVLADFGVVAGLFATYGPVQKGFEKGGEAAAAGVSSVKSTLTFSRQPQPDDYQRMNDDADPAAKDEKKKGSRWNCFRRPGLV